MTNDFSVENLVQSIRHAAALENPEDAIRDVLRETVKNPDAIFAATSGEDEDETLYFEDDSVSIWRCRFQPKILMPPHEHCLKVLIGAYSGGEKSILYKRTDEGLKEAGTVTAHAGEVITLGKAAIHAVTTHDDNPRKHLHAFSLTPMGYRSLMCIFLSTPWEPTYTMAMPTAHSQILRNQQRVSR